MDPLKRRLRRLNRRFNRIIYSRKFSPGFDVMDADWDNLIIIDGCRYDYFEEFNTIDGELTKITSQGSHSTEFLEETFKGKQFHDTIYITANPHAPRLISDEFYLMDTLYEENHTSPPREHFPENVLESARSIIEQYPDKRYIIHFMQPNVPFLGPTAEEIREKALDEEIIFTGMTSLPEGVEPKREFGTLKEACEKRYITRPQFLKTYEENVQIAIENAEKLLQDLDGKTAITADHGEMLGERLPPLFFKQFGHDPYLYTPEIREVPWLVIESDTRREITSEEPIESDELDEKVIKDRLEHLGYADFT
jgi:hypothetical protein